MIPISKDNADPLRVAAVQITTVVETLDVLHGFLLESGLFLEHFAQGGLLQLRLRSRLNVRLRSQVVFLTLGK
jgi:hypothetical protein